MKVLIFIFLKIVEVEKPIQIINFTTGNEAATMVQPRNLIVVEENAHVQIIERHQSLTENAVLTNVLQKFLQQKLQLLIIIKFRMITIMLL